MLFLCLWSADHTSHRLLFNISVPQQERVVSAELRLHMLLKTDSHQRIGAGWKVSVFDARCQRDPLASKHVYSRESGWEVFDMTHAVQHWRKANALTPTLEVRIENLQAFRNTNVDLDIDRNPDGKLEPALIVFSDDSSEIHQLQRKMKEEDQDEMLLTKHARTWSTTTARESGAALKQRTAGKPRCTWILRTSAGTRSSWLHPVIRRSPAAVHAIILWLGKWRPPNTL